MSTTGFVAHHFKAKHPFLSRSGTLSPSFNHSSWIAALTSKSNLTESYCTIDECYGILFLQFHDQYFSNETHIIQKIVDRVVNLWTVINTISK